MNLLIFGLGILFFGLGVYFSNMAATLWEVVQGVALGIAGVITGIVSVFFLAFIFNRFDLGFYLLGMVVIESGLVLFVGKSLIRNSPFPRAAYGNS